MKAIGQGDHESDLADVGLAATGAASVDAVGELVVSRQMSE